MRLTAGWGNLDNINLTELYQKTTPHYYVAHCLFEAKTQNDLFSWFKSLEGFSIKLKRWNFDSRQAY